MNKVRERIGEDGLINMDKNAIRDVVLQVQKELAAKSQAKKA